MEANPGTSGTAAMGTPDTSDASAAAGNGAAGMGSIVDKVTERARSRLDEGKSRVSGSLTAVATGLRNSGRQLSEKDEAMVGDYMERVADGVDRAAGYLQRTDAAEIAGSVERFARKRPAVFLGAAFVLGLAGARFLKSSRQNLTTQGENSLDSGRFGDREVEVTSVVSADLTTRTPNAQAARGEP